MENSSIEVLEREWQHLTSEHKRAIRQARVQGLPTEQLDALDRKYTLLIDSAYARLKYAEERDAWRGRISPGPCQLVASKW